MDSDKEEKEVEETVDADKEEGIIDLKGDGIRKEGLSMIDTGDVDNDVIVIVLIGNLVSS